MTWLTGWTYQKQLYISSTNSTTQSSYQMKITVNYGSGIDSTGNIYCGSNCNTDFSDIRFTDTDGTTILPYWIESYTVSFSAIVWINIPSIPTGTNSTYIYFYYNNPSATSISNGTSTFDFFDDFSGNLSKWTLTGAGGSIVSGKLQLTANTIARGNISFNNGILEGFYSGNANSLIKYHEIGFDGDNGSTAGTHFIGGRGIYPNPYYTQWHYNINGSGEAAGTAGTNSQSGYIKIERSGTITNIYQKTNYTDAYTSIKANVTDTMTGLYPAVTVYQPGYIASFDNIFVRKFASPEPTWGTIVTGSLNISSTPPGAETYLNGVDQSTTTTSPGTTISNLSPDTYYILLRLTGYADWTGTATVSSGTTTSVSATISHTQWLTSWNRRKQLYISGTTAGPQPSYQMKITVNYSSGTDIAGSIYCGSNVKSDFSDIRFTDSTGSTLLNYWVESYTSGSIATIWIQIPYILTGSNSVYIYIYYNNPSATTVSNGTNTFVAWHGQVSGTSSGPINLYLDPFIIPNTNWAYTSLVNISNSRDMGWGVQDSAAGNRTFLQTFYTSYVVCYQPNGTYYTNAPNLTNGTHTIVLKRFGTEAHYYTDGTERGTGFTGIVSSGSLGLVLYLASGSLTSYYAFARNYVNPEPTWSSTISAEQLTVTLHISSNPIGAEVLLAFPSGTSYIDQLVQTTTTTYIPGSTTTIHATGTSTQNYDLKLTLGGYLDYILPNQLFTTGQTYDIRTTLIPIPGSYSISAAPTGITYGGFSYGSVTIGGSIGIIICGTPKANLVVMDQLLKIGYTHEEISKLINLIG